MVCTGGYWFYTGRGAYNALVGISRQSRIIGRALVDRESLIGSTRGRPDTSRKRERDLPTLALSLSLFLFFSARSTSRERPADQPECERGTSPPRPTQPNPREGGGGEREGEEASSELSAPKVNVTTFRGTVVEGRASTSATEKIREENPKLPRTLTSQDVPTPHNPPPKRPSSPEQPPSPPSPSPRPRS